MVLSSLVMAGCGTANETSLSNEAVSDTSQSIQLASAKEYTLDADFDQGTLVNVVHDPNHDQLALDETTKALNFIWIAVSSKGTLVRIDTRTGAVLGEYKSSPAGRGANPSRTTVDKDGNVWLTNRDEWGVVAANAISAGIPATTRGMGSVTHVGLVENGQCEDRNGNGQIDTSTGLGDVRPWTNAGGANTYGGVSTAEDECIIHYSRVNSTGARHVSVQADNNVWVSGTGGRFFDLLNGSTGAIIRQESPVNYGGYGGLIDANGVIWSANPMLRWDTVNPLSGPNGTNWRGYSHPSYGLCIDSQGNVWNTSYGYNVIRKFSPAGDLIGTYPQGNNYAQGCVVDRNDHVWVAHSLGNYRTVGHLLPDGTLLGNVDLGEVAGPTGVAVDGDGKIWATGYVSHKAYRIDPTLGDVGVDDVTRVGAVDFVTPNLGGYLYNYSDMTGSTLQGAPTSGSWTTTYDTGFDDAEWGTVSWNALVPGDAGLQVLVASSLDNVVFGPEQAVVSGSGITVDNGRYLRIRVLFNRSSAGESPILYDLRVSTECGNGIVDPGEECDDGNSVNGDGCSATCAVENHPPQAVCMNVTVSANAQCLANASVDGGSSDPDGDPIVCVQNPGNPYSLGVAVVTLTCTDPRGATDACVANVTVVDSTGPAISCPPNEVVECSAGAAPVSFSNPTATDNCAIAGTACTAASGDIFPLGTTNVSCTATDGAGNTSACDFDVVVTDTTPPEVDVTQMEPLWSPNHKYVTKTLADCGVVVQDLCQGPIPLTQASAAITCVTSDEPDNGLGDGDQEADMVIVDAETVMLRAERSGQGDGRVYQIHFTVSDAAGNESQDVCEVTVPRNRSNPLTVNSSVQSTVGTCQ